MMSVSLPTASFYAYAGDCAQQLLLYNLFLCQVTYRSVLLQDQCPCSTRTASRSRAVTNHLAACYLATQLPAKTSAKPWCTRKREQTSSTFKMGAAIWQIPRESPQYETELKKLTNISRFPQEVILPAYRPVVLPCPLPSMCFVNRRID